MFKLNDNYYHRKCYFEREQVPTQTVMINKMKPPLAHVYFKSMSPKLKILAGLEPPMQGGGSDWFMAPKDLLESKAVLKPVKKEYLTKLGFNGIDFFGEKIVKAHHRAMELEKRKVLLESDMSWKKTIENSCTQQWESTSKEEAQANTLKIQQAFREFSLLYTTSITQIEEILFDASMKHIERVREGAYQKMLERLRNMVKQQATELYDKYTDKLMKKKASLKAEFIANVEKCRTDMGNQLHDINVEKHVAIEKLRHLLECQNLACQIYVALKEREVCKQEMDLSEHMHMKRVKLLRDEIAMKDFEIKLEIEKDKKRQQFAKIWKTKICHLVKKFQMFVEFCLHTLPEHAEFFINMEKLMMLQLSDASENPSTESLFVPEPEFHTPIPKPHPFYLFCDKGYKPQLDQDLCPKHCTSSASQLPVIVINKRCIYAACDNFQTYSNKVTRYIYGQRGDDIDFEDDHSYTYNIPVKYTSSQQLLELKLESSLMQILQKELPNIKEVPIECCVCGIPYCFCSLTDAKAMSTSKPVEKVKDPSLESIPSGNKIKTRNVELEHEREPKWDSYLDYVRPRKCVCAKTAKKHLKEHMPPYMLTMSPFDAPDLPNYEPCSVETLRKLVKQARGKRTPEPEPEVEESTKRNAFTQYEDQYYENICTCYSDEEIKRLFEGLLKGSKMFNENKVGDIVTPASSTPSYLAKTASSFATKRAYSLRHLINESPDLEEIFMKKDCTFD